MLTVKRYLIKGRVQGVGFRKFVMREAERLGVKGWVKNIPDGSVESLAFAEKNVLYVFEEKLKKGPLFSKVTEVSAIETQERDETPDLFLILE